MENHQPTSQKVFKRWPHEFFGNGIHWDSVRLNMDTGDRENGGETNEGHGRPSTFRAILLFRPSWNDLSMVISGT